MFKKTLLLATVAVVLTSGCSSPEGTAAPETAIAEMNATEPLSAPVATTVEAVATAPTPTEPEPKIEPVTPTYEGVAYEITEEAYPKVYASWGKDWIDNINRMMPLAVTRAAANPKCDAPSTADLSDNRSLVKKDAVFYVDCINGERFYMSQAELIDPKPLVAENDILGENFGAYTLACKELTKTKLPSPTAFNPKNNSINTFKGSSGNMVVEIPFTSVGGTLDQEPMLSRCIFSTTGETEVSIVKAASATTILPTLAQKALPL